MKLAFRWFGGALALWIALIVWAFWGRGLKPLDVADIQGLGHVVDVGTAICLAYLGLDRFRYRRRINELADKLAEKVDGRTAVLRLMEDGKKLTIAHRFILALYASAGDAQIRASIKAKKHDLKSAEFIGTFRSAAAWMLIGNQVDWFVVVILTTSLCTWQFYAAGLEIFVLEAGHRSFPVFADIVPTHRLALLAYVLAICSYALPAAAFAVNESLFSSLKNSINTWTDALAEEEQCKAESAKITGLTPIPSSLNPGV
ncbi:MAG: hypothetical protein ACYDD1_15995 [Caulobacteraceae bacterium]